MIKVMIKYGMDRILQLLRNRDFILFLALGLGLLWGDGARWTHVLTLPALALAMTLSVMGIPGNTFRPIRSLTAPALLGIVMTYPVLSSAILGLSALIVSDERIWEGFVIIAAVPPGVAVIPFTSFLRGNAFLSLVGTMGAYLGALLLTPLIALLFLGANFINPVKVLIIMLELILGPLILARVLVRTGASRRIEPLKGALTNWSFFVVTYTIVGLNREVFLGEPLSLFPAALISLVTTFLLGWMIEAAGRFFRLDPKTTTSLVLLGTIKNFGLAGGMALALFSRQTAVPATVSTVFMIVYIIWLGIKSKG